MKMGDKALDNLRGAVQGGFAKAFAEWDRRYREEPAKFDSDMQRIMRGQTTEEYGTTAAIYFMSIMDDLEMTAQEGEPQDEQ
jgi:hypothetical protein